MGGLFLLLVLSVVMALASFLAGALPLSMTLSQSQLRLISSIGVGILVGTSLIVIIPEGVEAVTITGMSPHSHGTRGLIQRWAPESIAQLAVDTVKRSEIPEIHTLVKIARDEENAQELENGHAPTPPESGQEHEHDEGHSAGPEQGPKPEHTHSDETKLPTFSIGFSLILGFVLMFLIDRLPQHATEQFHSVPATRHISLDNLRGGEDDDDDAEAAGFLGSLAMSPRQSRSLATTTGLVIHAAADGIAMGASATTEDMKLGFIIFVAIMIHKAPAAFGLTSLLLKQGLSKRAARGHLVVFSLAAPTGALATWMLIKILGGGNLEGEGGQWWTGMLLLFSGGTFLYVAMHAMQEDSISSHDHSGMMNGNGYADGGSGLGQQRRSGRPQMRDTLATIGGMLLPLLTQFGHHH